MKFLKNLSYWYLAFVLSLIFAYGMLVDGKEFTAYINGMFHLTLLVQAGRLVKDSNE